MNLELLEALPYPVYIVDPFCVVQGMNGRAEALSLTLEIPGQLPLAVRPAIEAAVAAGRNLVGDDLRRAVEIASSGPGDSSSRSAYVPHVTRIAGNSGAEPRWMVVLTDVSQLRQLDAAKTKAMSTLGHEVKTPVASIRMVLHLLLEEKVGPLTSDQRELVAAGREDCERLLTILQAMLELARFEGRRVELKLKPVAVEELLASVGLHLEPLPTDLPQVMTDPAHATRALKNLAGVTLPVLTSGEKARARAEVHEDGWVRLIVCRASNRLISETECERIFEPFALKTEQDPEQSGLGLTMAREIAAALGGRVAAASAESALEFWLDLPIAGRLGRS